MTDELQIINNPVGLLIHKYYSTHAFPNSERAILKFNETMKRVRFGDLNFIPRLQFKNDETLRNFTQAHKDRIKVENFIESKRADLMEKRAIRNKEEKLIEQRRNEKRNYRNNIRSHVWNNI
jgi:hypothetical protein